MRKGPHPLSVHIGMAASEMARQGLGVDDIEYEQAFTKMLLGMQRYQNSDVQVPRPDLVDEVTLGECKLRGLRALSGNSADLPVILLVPSMINRYHIFNLTAERSMVRYFAAQGYRPLVVDWGDPVKDTDLANFDALFQSKLLPVLDYLGDKYDCVPHVVGYCMGGLLSIALSALAPQCVASLSLIATPWDFKAGSASLGKRIDFWKSSAEQTLRDKNYLDQDWLQTLFASLDPLVTRNKFMKFADMPSGSAEELVFIAIEDWLNDGVDLPAQIATECITGWYQGNSPLNGTWAVCNKAINLADVSCPTLVVASDKDRLVDFESSACLLGGIADARLHKPQCGHIGMIAGSNAIKDVWEPISDFISGCNS